MVEILKSKHPPAAAPKPSVLQHRLYHHVVLKAITFTESFEESSCMLCNRQRSHESACLKGSSKLQ